MSRDLALDLFKTIIVSLMIAAHVLQLLTTTTNPGIEHFSTLVNLTAFSGFMFSFGIGVGLQGRRRHVRRSLRPALTMIGALYFSSMAAIILLERGAIDWPLMLDILSGVRLFAYSEFLATFAILYLIVALLRKPLMYLADNVRLLILSCALSLASCSLIIDFAWPFAGAIFGTTRFPSFPLLPYLIWFIFGVHLGLADRKPSVPELTISAAASLIFIFTYSDAGLPSRFPPSIFWVLGPALLLVGGLYFLKLRSWSRLPSSLLVPGRRVLASLIVSNATIFLISYYFDRPLTGSAGTALGVFGVLATVWIAVLAFEQASLMSKRPVY